MIARRQGPSYIPRMILALERRQLQRLANLGAGRDAAVRLDPLNDDLAFAAYAIALPELRRTLSLARRRGRGIDAPAGMLRQAHGGRQLDRQLGLRLLQRHEPPIRRDPSSVGSVPGRRPRLRSPAWSARRSPAVATSSGAEPPRTNRPAGTRRRRARLRPATVNSAGTASRWRRVGTMLTASPAVLFLPRVPIHYLYRLGILRSRCARALEGLPGFP